MDPELVVDLKLVLGKNAKCPVGYSKLRYYDDKFKSIVNKQDLNVEIEDEGGADTNDSSFTKVYLCIKKLKMSQAALKPINTLVINYNNDDCGTLEGLSRSIYNNWNSKNHWYLCFGHESKSKQNPIKYIAIVKPDDLKNKKKKDSYKNLECLEPSLNEKYYLCFEREEKTAHSFAIRNINYNFEEKTVSPLVNHPKILNTIIVDSISATVEVEVTKNKESNYNKALEVSGSLTLGFSIGDMDTLGWSFENSVTVSKSKKTEEGKQKEKQYTEKSSIECSAVEGKTIKCISSVFEYKSRIPYKYNLYAYDINGKQLIDTGDQEKNLEDKTLQKGVYEAVETSAVFLTTCCMDGCCAGDATETKPHCLTKDNTPLPKDYLCSEVDKCFK